MADLAAVLVGAEAQRRVDRAVVVLAGAVGALRFDPFAMLPFCGYNMADYFAHWLTIGRREGAELPKVLYVDWFRKDKEGNFIWPRSSR